MFRLIRRGLLTIVTLAVLAVLVCGFVSYRRGLPRNYILIDTDATAVQWAVGMIDGTLHVVVANPVTASAQLEDKHEWHGFYAKRIQVGSVLAAGAGAPFWAVATLLFIWPFIAFLRGPVRRWRRRRAGRCPACGYSLRGLDARRCPECGLPFSAERPVDGGATPV